MQIHEMAGFLVLYLFVWLFTGLVALVLFHGREYNHDKGECEEFVNSDHCIGASLIGAVWPLTFGPLIIAWLLRVILKVLWRS